MKFEWAKSQMSLRYGIAVLAGLLLALAFPKAGVAGFAWLAPGLMLAAGAGLQGGQAFRIGYVAGLAHFLTSLYWLLFIPVPIAPIVGWLALSAFLALYAGGWVWLCWKMFPAKVEHVSSLSLADAGWKPALHYYVSTSWVERVAWSLGCAALWVAWEMIQARLLSGFPWNFLGASQYRMLLLIQVASFAGVYGVSFIVAWTSIILVSGGAVLLHDPEKAWHWRRELALALVIVAPCIFFGYQQMRASSRPTAHLKVALVQPSIPQTTIWDRTKEAERFQQLLELSERALQSKPDLLVWPEAAVPSVFRWDTNLVYKGQTIFHAVVDLVKRYRVWMIMGADDAELNESRSGEADFFNSSFLMNPDGELIATYRKQRLVMFGEYVPLSKWLPFLKSFTQVYGEFKPGKAPVTFVIPDFGLKTSVLICFEDVFPHLARKHVEEDTDFLLNLTNNGWFGESAAQWQHAASAVFRAVENGLPLVRAANNGLTCWVDKHGGMHEVYFPGSKDIYGVGYKTVQVPLLSGNKREATFYNRHGDWFGWGCVILSASVLLAQALRRIAARKQS